jgi:acetyltransferase-like isoleucine patch superfamily enzyme
VLGTSVPADTQLIGVVRLAGTRQLRMGRRCRFGRDVQIDTVGEGRVSIGEQVTLNSGVFLVSHSSISLGDRCLVGEYVSVRDADHGTAPGESPLFQKHVTAEIKIGSDVWIGRGAVILKGVTIGDGAVVAANAVVSRDVAPGSLVAGVPARVLKNHLPS